MAGKKKEKKEVKQKETTKKRVVSSDNNETYNCMSYSYTHYPASYGTGSYKVNNNKI